MTVIPCILRFRWSDTASRFYKKDSDGRFLDRADGNGQFPEDRRAIKALAKTSSMTFTGPPLD